MRATYNVFPFIVGALILLLSFWMDIVTRLISTPAQVLPQGQPDLVAHDIQISLIGAHDRPEAILTAPLLKHFQNSTMEVTTPHVTYLGIDNSLEISSPAGSLTNNSQFVTLSGGTKVDWKRPTSTVTLTTDTLTADMNSGILKSTSPVLIQDGRNIVSGSSFSYNKHSGELEMNGPVTGILYPQDR